MSQPLPVRFGLALSLLIVSPGCFMRPGVSPGLEPQQEDYAQARKGFHTHLIHPGPAPQRWTPLVTPPGAEEVEYRSGALTLKAYASTETSAGQKHPAVLFLHGGFAFGTDDWQMVRPYQDAGFIVMCPALRGENGQPGVFSVFYDEVDDVLAAAEALSLFPDVDEGRIYVAGHSAGGTLAMLAAMASDRFRAAASLSGSPDQKKNVQQEPSFAVFDQSDPREFQLRSPVAFAYSFKCPVRLFYGSQELWAARLTERTAELAREKGIDAQAVEIPGDHFSSVPEGIRESIEFFRRN